MARNMRNASLFTLTLALGLLCGQAAAIDESGGIQSRRGNASPSVAESNVNEYTFQDDQVNLGPDDQDVLVLRTDEKVLMNRFVTKTFPIKNVTPREIRNVFRELTAKEGGRAEVIRDKKTKDNFLQVIAPKWQMPFIEETISVLDKDWLEEYNDGGGTVYYKAKYRDADVIDGLAENWGGEGFSTVDSSNNSVLRFDEPYRLESYLKGAKTVDLPEHQGRFSVKVYELNTNNDTRLGLDYVAWKNGPGRNLFGFGSAGYYLDQHGSSIGSLLTSFPSSQNKNRDYWGYYNFLVTASYVDFLASKGKAKTLASGTVQVKSGATGTFNAADQVVSFVAEPNNPGSHGDHGDPLYNEAEHLSIYDRTLNRRNTGEVGVFVELKPVILKESVEMEVVAEVSSVAGYTPQGLPIINSTETVTKARLQDGSVLVLSGLSRDEQVESKAGMPLLGDLPVLGYLFGGENNINRQKQIVIVIESETETGGSSILENPAEIDTIASQVEGESLPQVPRNPFGFDMWLLGESSGGQI